MSLDHETAAEFRTADYADDLDHQIVAVRDGRIFWSGNPATGLTVEWDLGLARFMLAEFRKTPSTRFYAVALDGAIAEAEAYHAEHSREHV